MVKIWETMRREEGQTLVEYGLIISLIAIACIVALGFISGEIQSLLSDIGNGI